MYMLLISFLGNPLRNEHHQQNQTPTPQHQKSNPQKQIPIPDIVRLTDINTLLPKTRVKSSIKT